MSLRGLFGVTAGKGILGLIDQAAVSGASFLTTVAIGRFCGAQELGIYALGFSLVVLVTGAQTSLISIPYTIFMKRLPESERSWYAGSVLVHYALLAALAMLALVGLALLLSIGLGPARLAQVVWVLLGIMPFVLLREFLRRLAFAHLQMTAALLLDVVVCGLQIGGLVGLVASEMLSAITGYAVMGLACAIASVASFFLVRTEFVVRGERIGRDLQRNWSLGKWVFSSQMTLVAHGYLVHWLLAVMLDTTATGVFTACLTVVMVVNPFVAGISNVLEPRVAQAFAEGGRDEVRRVAWKTTALMEAVMAMFCIAIMLIGEDAVRLLYDGPEYSNQGATIIVLALLVLTRIDVPAAHGLRVMGRADANFKAALLDLTISLVSTLILVPYLGVLGGAIGFLIGSVPASVMRCLIFFRLVGSTRPRAGTT